MQNLPKYPIIPLCRIRFGSFLYGTATPNSDLDYKIVYLPDPRELYTMTAPRGYTDNTSDNTKSNTADDVDCEYITLAKFIELAIAGDTMAIDMLHVNAENLLESSEIWDFIQAHRHEFYTTSMDAYLGYVQKQAARYGVKGSRFDALRVLQNTLVELYEEHARADSVDLAEGEYVSVPGGSVHKVSWLKSTKIRDIKDRLPVGEHTFFTTVHKGGCDHTYYSMNNNFYPLAAPVNELVNGCDKKLAEYGTRAKKAADAKGVDWKALAHALRAGMQLKEIVTTGDLVYPLRDAETLREVRAGMHDLDFVIGSLESVVNSVDDDMKQAAALGMRSVVDVERWERFVSEATHGVYSKLIKG